MRTFDFSPIYRSAIGFDRVAQLFDEALRSESTPGYRRTISNSLPMTSTASPWPSQAFVAKNSKWNWCAIR